MCCHLRFYVLFAGPLETPDQPDSETKLLSGCDPNHNLSLPGAPTSSEFSNHASDSTVSMPLAEAFPFMSQEQLLQLLTSNAGLPSLLPPFLGSLPLGIWTGQSSAPSGAQSQQAAGAILNQGSPLNMLSDLPLNLVTMPSSAGVDGAEKPPGLQALLMASLLLGQNPAAMLPLPPLNLELPPPQQVFPEGVSLEKTPALLDSVLMWPGLLEALQTLTPSADCQSLMLSAPPPSFLSLNPALLAAALGQTEPLPNHMQSPPLHSQVVLKMNAKCMLSSAHTLHADNQSVRLLSFLVRGYRPLVLLRRFARLNRMDLLKNVTILLEYLSRVDRNRKG